jgi:tyrosyl-tRNA synthetase
MDEVNRLSFLKDAEINKAKEILAYEVTKLVHGDEEARKAQDAARALFAGGGNMDEVPKTQMPASAFEGEGMGVVSLIAELKLVTSKGDGFRTIEQGGLAIDDVKVTDTKLMVTKDMFRDGKILIKKGKKTFHMVELI